jgi:ankyrin repeat protein
LQIAALKGQSLAAMLLAHNGADILAQDSTGRTASQLAREVGYKELANDLWQLEKEQRSARTAATNSLPTPKPNPALQPLPESTPEYKPTPKPNPQPERPKEAKEHKSVSAKPPAPKAPASRAIHKRDNNIKEPISELLNAIQAGDLTKAVMAIEAGAEINDPNQVLPPILAAAYYGQADIVELLVQHGADVEIRTVKFNQTPLHIAAVSGHEMAALTLAKHGANLLALDSMNRHASQLAQDAGHAEFAHRLRRLEVEFKKTQVARVPAIPSAEPQANYKHPGLLPTQFIIPKFPKPWDQERDRGRER